MKSLKWNIAFWFTARGWAGCGGRGPGRAVRAARAGDPPPWSGGGLGAVTAAVRRGLSHNTYYPLSELIYCILWRASESINTLDCFILPALLYNYTTRSIVCEATFISPSRSFRSLWSSWSSFPEVTKLSVHFSMLRRTNGLTNGQHLDSQVCFADNNQGLTI